ncbi:MAG: UbiA family prenyltransferase [Thermoguttaceae bacterium]
MMNDFSNPENFDDAEESRLRFRNHSAVRSYLDLLRIPNVFTAMADVAMGFLFVQAVGWRFASWPDLPALATLLLASSLLYLAGVVLNDVFDLEIDQTERPERPLPSGRIAMASARRLGWRLLVAGVAAGSAVVFFVGQFRPGIVAALLAICILLYDAWLKRTPLGPLAMGACRMLNVLLGMSAVDGSLHAEHWAVAGGLGLYVTGVTWFARRENRRGVRWQLILATAAMASGIGLLASLPHWSDRLVPHLQAVPRDWWLLTGAIGGVILWRCVWAVLDPIPARVRIAVAQGVLSIVVLDAVACYAVRDVFWASLILCLLVPAMFLGRWIEVT